ncbi:hypothetical protein BHM03_00022608 [Ensete ventricosum]|uniref:Uncharacterized protein n=1 Tax=Ensete ventricosum TaxID=4639 RepID=A0A445MGI0_ENSVE|nr:hypothetical protein BHM03_00022608 [Ensete ventricosum]
MTLIPKQHYAQGSLCSPLRTTTPYLPAEERGDTSPSRGETRRPLLALFPHGKTKRCLIPAWGDARYPPGSGRSTYRYRVELVPASALQVRTRSQAIGVAHEERDSEQDECEVGYSLRVEEAQSRAPIGKRSHKERLTMAETRLDVLEASSEELYQGQ